MLKDIYVIDGKYENNILTLKRNDKNEIPINLDIEQKGFTWYYDNQEEQQTTPQDDPIVDPDPINPDPQDPPVVDPDPVDPDPQEPDPTPNIYNVHVHINNSSWGNVQCLSEQVTEGNSVSINVTANIGYEIQEFTIKRGSTGVPITITGTSYTVQEVNSDIYVSVSFKVKEQIQPADTYTVTFSVGQGGEIDQFIFTNANGRTEYQTELDGYDEQVKAGTTAELRVFTNEGYSIKSISYESTRLNNINPYIGYYTVQIPVNNNLNISVQFERLTTVNPEDNTGASWTALRELPTEIEYILINNDVTYSTSIYILGKRCSDNVNIYIDMNTRKFWAQNEYDEYSLDDYVQSTKTLTFSTNKTITGKVVKLPWKINVTECEGSTGINCFYKK